MLISTIVMGVVAIAVFIIAYQKGGGIHMAGLKATGNLLLQMFPLLVFALLIGNTIPLLIPPQTISTWVGTESGIRGILIGTAVGGLLPGGPFISLPIVAGLLQVGASIGTVVALLTAWSLLAFTRLPLEIGILGWQFTLIRLACTCFFPPIAGIIANKLFSGVNIV